MLCLWLPCVQEYLGSSKWKIVVCERENKYMFALAVKNDGSLHEHLHVPKRCHMLSCLLYGEIYDTVKIDYTCEKTW